MKKILAILAMSIVFNTSAYADLAADVANAVKDKKEDAAIEAAVAVKLYDAVVCVTKKDGKFMRKHSEARLNGEVTDADDKKIMQLYFAAAEAGNRNVVSFKLNNRKFEAEVIRVNENTVCVARTAGVQ
ncbi:MAG: hypothetical protein Q8S21_02460 [Candidatus Paracaedibacteraceae bacterium]|nr:hypothetical protein [Candidatus Paracaedibacteraceae bacterium]